MSFAPHAAAGLLPGRVVLEHNHVFRVVTRDGELLAESAGRMKHRAEGRQALPVVGDWVAVRVDPGGRSQIREVLPRQSRFSRKAAGRETEEQVVATNIDTILIVFGLDLPVNSNAIERYLVVARHGGAEPIIVLNKSDLIERPEELEAEVALARAAAGEATVIVLSTRTGAGLAAIESYLRPGKTMALIGPSGAGKSSLVNALIGRELLATGEVRDWDARGRHTSVHRQLVVRDKGGLVIDTPGMRELQLWDTDAVAETFGDIDAVAVDCRFRDCRHDTEPGCAVKKAVEAGSLDAGRFESFRKLQAEQDAIEKKRDERLLAEDKRHAKAQHRSLRAFQKSREKERG